jgi:hypothetical protein
MKKIFIFLLMFLMVLPMINAVPPVRTFMGDGTNDLEIKCPIFDYIRQGENFEFEVHVFNKSNGVYMTDVGCYIHLYNDTGRHILTQYDDTVSHDFDYSFKYNFTDVGQYHYIIQCNNSAQGGFSSAAFEVTNNGLENPTKQAMVLGVGLVAFLLLYLGFNLDKQHFILKLLTLCLFVGMLILIPAVLIGGFSIMTTFAKTITWFFRFFFTYLFIFAIYWAYKYSQGAIK